MKNGLCPFFFFLWTFWLHAAAAPGPVEDALSPVPFEALSPWHEPFSPHGQGCWATDRGSYELFEETVPKTSFSSARLILSRLPCRSRSGILYHWSPRPLVRFREPLYTLFVSYRI